MAIFMHSVNHYAAIARAVAEEKIPIPTAVCPVETDEGLVLSLRDLLFANPIHAVNLMARENALSVEYVNDEPVKRIEVHYEDLERAPELLCEEALYALSSVRFQSCEHPGWEERGWRQAFLKLVPASSYYGPVGARPHIRAWQL
jgi:hypothetical protein